MVCAPVEALRKVGLGSVWGKSGSADTMAVVAMAAAEFEHVPGMDGGGGGGCACIELSPCYNFF